MKHALYFITLLLLVTLACSGITPAREIPSATPKSSDTPAPTVTLPPTDTPTPEPTSTPDKTATAAVRSTAEAQTVLDELDQLLGDTDVPYQNGHLAWQQGQALTVSLKGPSWDYVGLDEDLSAGNFILKSDVTWEATGIIICSAIFRSESNLEKGKQYRFSSLRFSGLPIWEFDVFENNRLTRTLTKAKFSDAIDLDNGATNTVMLVVQDDHFDLFINGADQGRYYDSSKQFLTNGHFAFRADEDSGEGTCNFENSWVWALE
jgi:hypothetical protein